MTAPGTGGGIELVRVGCRLHGVGVYPKSLNRIPQDGDHRR